MLSKKLINKLRGLLFALCRTAFLLAIIYVILFPILYAISSSFLTEKQLIDPSVVWIPKEITFSNYIEAWKVLDYGNNFIFTMFLVIVSTLFQIFSCTLAAYGFARFNFKLRGLLFFCVIITIVLPPQMLVVQQYAIFKGMHLLNSVFTYFLPALLGQGIRSGLMIYIFRQFIKGLPRELEEAAYIDGCSVFMTFWRIVVPSTAISFLVVLIFSMVWYWNETLTASMFFDNIKPMAVMLAEMKQNISAEQVGINAVRNVLMSGVVLFITPMIIMYGFLQKYFIQGIERSGLVG